MSQGHRNRGGRGNNSSRARHIITTSAGREAQPTAAAPQHNGAHHESSEAVLVRPDAVSELSDAETPAFAVTPAEAVPTPSDAAHDAAALEMPVAEAAPAGQPAEANAQPQSFVQAEGDTDHSSAPPAHLTEHTADPTADHTHRHAEGRPPRFERFTRAEPPGRLTLPPATPPAALEHREHEPLRPEARGEVGNLIDALHDLFAHDRAVASQGGSTRCGICYLHFPLTELTYRDDEGYYVCAACAHGLSRTRLNMVRRQRK